MRRHRRHSTAFKRQSLPRTGSGVVEEYHAGASLYGLAKAHDVFRNLIRVWLEKHEAGAFDEDARAANMLHEREARIAALKRLAGQTGARARVASKGAANSRRSPRSAPTSAITGPAASPSRGGAS